MSTARLLVISVDALTDADMPFLSQLKNFERLFKGGACVRHVRSVYPSITYPAHVALTTGRNPASNGMFSNLVTMDANPDGRWYWDASIIQGDDLFRAAHRAGVRVGASAWPVTSNHPCIDYLMPEYWMAVPAPTLREGFAAHGAAGDVLDMLEERSVLLKPGYMAGKSAMTIYPYYDDFNLNVAADIIRKHAPEMMFVHINVVDSIRHATGVFNARVTAAIAKADEYFGLLADALEAAGVLEDTNIVLLSDHGQIDFSRRVKLNVLLADHGLLHVEENGRIAENWTAYSLSNGMSAYIFVKGAEGSENYLTVEKLLRDTAAEGLYGFDRVFTRRETAEKYHLDGDFAFVVESDGYTAFSDDAQRPLLAEVDLRDYRYGKATHGYLPERGPQPVFYAKGRAFRGGAVLENAHITDIAPTLAAAMHLELREAEGTVLQELLC